MVQKKGGRYAAATLGQDVKVRGREGGRDGQVGTSSDLSSL